MTTLTSGCSSVRASSRALGGGSSPPSVTTSGSTESEAVIALRIHHAHAIALKDELLAEQTGQPRFAGARLARDENRPAAHRERDLGSIVLVAKHEMAPSHLDGRQPRLLREAAHVGGHCCGAGAVDDLVGDGSERMAPPCHRRADFARIEEVVIVLRVADPHGVVDGNPQGAQRLAKACRLGHGLRKHHEAPSIERQGQRQLEGSQHLQDGGCGRRVRLDDAFTEGELHVAAAQLVQKSRVRRMRQRHVSSAGREVQYGPVLGDDHVEERQISGSPPQVSDPSACGQDDDDPLPPEIRDRTAHSGIEHAVDRDRAVVVERNS